MGKEVRIIFVLLLVGILCLGFISAGWFNDFFKSGPSFSPGKGDVNGDGNINIIDLNFLRDYLYMDGPAPNPLEAGDINDDGEIDISDISVLVQLIGEENTCVDSDDGLDYFTKATCVDFDGTMNDGCIIGGDHDGWLREINCEDRSKGLMCQMNDFECKYGCKDGACVPTTCEELNTEYGSAPKNYFVLCRDEGYDLACFNKFTGEYQGCVESGNNGCTLNNENADKNILCEITPECSVDSDCPSDSRNYCSGGNACTESIYYNCDRGVCKEIGGSGGCKICEHGCANGECLAGSGVDTFKFEKASNKLNIGESLRDVIAHDITDSEFPNFLIDSSVSSYKYFQSIKIGDLILTEFSDSDYNDKEETIGFHLRSNDFVLNYTLDFGLDVPLDKLKSNFIYFLGKNYYILDAKTSSPYDSELVLFGSATSASVQEGETVTISVGGKSYDVFINFIDSSSVKLDINGELINKMGEGSTYKLSDGSRIGIEKISSSDIANDYRSVKFVIGSEVIEIKNDQNLNINSEFVDLKGWVKVNSVGELDKISIEWRVDDESFITEERSLYLPFFNALRLRFEGLTESNDEFIGHVYLDGFYGEGGVCYGLIEKVKNPTDFTLAGINFNSYEQWTNSYRNVYYIDGKEKEATDYHASWNGHSNDENYFIDYGITVFDDKEVNALSWFKERRFLDDCRATNHKDEEGRVQKIYICNWEIFRADSDLRQYSSDNKQVFWTNENILVQLYLHKGRYLSDEEMQKLSQERLGEFLESLIDNERKYLSGEAFSIDFPLYDLIRQDLGLCGSDVPLDTCSACWNCRTEPVICPPHGSQTKICEDRCCDNKREMMKGCTPGICSGCMVPKWFGSKWSDNRCIPYGFRFEQQTEDFVEKLIEYEESEILEEFDDEGEVSLVIESAEKAILTLYDKEGNAYEFILVPGAKVELDVPGFFEDMIDLVMYVDSITYKPDGESYIDVTIKYSYMGKEYITFNAYCDINGKFKVQKTVDSLGNWATCQNNYECESNVCSSGECIELTTLLQEASAFKRVAVKFVCKIFNPFSDDEYNKCISNFLGVEGPSSSSGGGRSSGGGGSGP